MSNLEKILRDVGYFGVGAAATVVEAGGKVIKALVNKGEETIRDNQDTVDEIVRKAKEFGEKVKDTVEKATACDEAPEETEAPVECCCDCDAPAAEESSEAAQDDDEPVVPDVIYRTAEPAPEEDAAPEEAESEEAVLPDEEPAAPVAEESTEPTAEEPVPAAPAAGEIPVLNVPEDGDPKEFLNRY